MSPRVCVLEDPRVAENHLGRRLRRAGLEVELVDQQPRRFLSALSARLPSVAVVDVSHARGERLRCIETLTRTWPAMHVVAVLPRHSGDLARHCRAAGADVCVEKVPGDTRPLLQAIAKARHKRPRRQGPVRRPLDSLTAREREVLARLADGLDNLKIGALLGITERTVKAHVTSIYAKLGAQSRVELALAARGLFSEI